VISDFRPEVDETCALLGYNASRLLTTTTGCLITQESAGLGYISALFLRCSMS